MASCDLPSRSRRRRERMRRTAILKSKQMTQQFVDMLFSDYQSMSADMVPTFYPCSEEYHFATQQSGDHEMNRVVNFFCSSGSTQVSPHRSVSLLCSIPPRRQTREPCLADNLPIERTELQSPVSVTSSHSQTAVASTSKDLESLNSLELLNSDIENGTVRQIEFYPQDNILVGISGDEQQSTYVVHLAREELAPLLQTVRAKRVRFRSHLKQRYKLALEHDETFENAPHCSAELLQSSSIAKPVPDKEDEDALEYSHAQLHYIIDMAVQQFWANAQSHVTRAGILHEVLNDVATNMKVAFPVM